MTPEMIERAAKSLAFSTFTARRPNTSETPDTVWSDLLDEGERHNFREDAKDALACALNADCLQTANSVARVLANRELEALTPGSLMHHRSKARQAIGALHELCLSRAAQPGDTDA